MKNQLFVIILLSVLLAGFTNFPVNSTPMVTLQQDQINGIYYEHGWVHYTDTGNFTNEGSGFINESYTETTTTTMTVPLVTGYSIVDVYYKIIKGTYNDVKDRIDYSTMYMDNETLMNWVDWVFNLNSSDSHVRLNFTKQYDIVMTPILSNNTYEYLGQIATNASLFEYFEPVGFLNYVYTFYYVEPVAIILNLSTVEAEVNIKENFMAMAILGYYYRYSIKYSVDGWAYRVSVTDGENFAFQALMFDNVSASYTEIGAMFMQYFFLAFHNYTLRYVNNGSLVPLEMYPRSMFPVFAWANGSSYDVAVNYANLTAVTTLQSLVAAFASVTNSDNTTEAKLTIWATQKATTLIAYKDGNQNNVLDLNFNENGLIPDQGDIVTHVGFGEAYELQTIQYFAHSENSSETMYLPAYDLNFTKTTNDTQEFFVQNDITFGDINADRTVTPYWENPTVLDNGIVHFKFGMVYDDFPMTWVNVNTGKQTVDPERVSYMYNLWVDPENGNATVSPTFTFGGITDSALKAQMTDTSLALPVMVELFAAKATHTVTQSNEKVNATRTVRGAAFAIKTGEGSSLVEIDMPDSKKNYTVSGETHEAHLSALNLVTITGVVGEETEFPVNTETGDVAGTAIVNSQKEQSTISFIYMQDLLVVSYPVWNGNEIVHDPDYNINYEPTPKTTTSTSTTSSSTTSTSNTSTSTQPTSEESSQSSPTSQAGLPFPTTSLIISIIAVPVIITIIKKRK